MSENEMIVGIDLGTTNSEIAALVDNQPQVLGPTGSQMLPSCVGISPGGELLVGEAARNQLLVYPEMTARSVKRQMGDNAVVRLGEKEFTPPEISALILRELAEWAQRQLGQAVSKAVITVPAYFSDAQRQATRQAGELAGLEVLRILNEPTAASLAYGFGDDVQRTVMVYDLGGGTFDVSIVSMEGEVTEVLASHGNNHLGGDDFDQLILDRLLAEFQSCHGIDLKDRHPASYSRLRWAAEEAKKKLSFEPYVTIREENLATADGQPLHLELELARSDYEEMIQPLVETTLESVTQAMEDAGKNPGDIDALLLVGGSTRTPLIWQVLEERVGVKPRLDVHPDLCVALGAGLLASRLAGHDVERVLVDVSPYSFGPSHLGDRDGVRYPYCYQPIIHRNTPLPVTRTDSYYTAHPYQKEVEVEIFQGDDPDALKNIPVGSFRVEGLATRQEPNEVLCRMSLDLDGILQVTAIEKCTGKSKYITINNALKPKSDAELAAGRQRLQDIYASRFADLDDLEFEEMLTGSDSSELDVVEAEVTTPQGAQPALRVDQALAQAVQDANGLTARSRELLGDVCDEDKEEMIGLHEEIESAIERQDRQSLSAATDKLKELLFFIEGK